jgi:hypothetical protein
MNFSYFLVDYLFSIYSYKGSQKTSLLDAHIKASFETSWTRFPKEYK